MLKIELKEIKIKDIVESYIDNGVDGIYGYGGKLNIRPQFQREFVYKEEQRNAVIDTIFKGFPLNVMYWVQNDDGSYELLDGQQRTISFCQFFANEFMTIIKGNLKTFESLTKDEKDMFLNYKCMIYICKGNDSEKLEWFKVINTAGEKLTDQELRNACYPGKWLTNAKIQFSKPQCPAYSLANRFLNGSSLRQDYLETALDWIRKSQGLDSIEAYMLKHQQDPNSIELWNYFTNVINWVNTLFPKYRKEMKGVAWGELYNNYHNNIYDPDEFEQEVSKLMVDDEILNKKGIYTYVFSKLEKYLNLRGFSEGTKLKVYEKQHGKCPRCLAMNKPTKDKIWDISEMEADHIKPWHLGGKTIEENCQMLCKECNREKGGR